MTRNLFLLKGHPVYRQNLVEVIILFVIEKWPTMVIIALWSFCYLPVSQHVPVHPALQLHRAYAGVPPLRHASLLHLIVSLKWYLQVPPQHSVTLLLLVRVCVPALPHWCEHGLQLDQPPTWQCRIGGGLRLRRRRRHPSTCRKTDRVIHTKISFIDVRIFFSQLGRNLLELPTSYNFCLWNNLTKSKYYHLC